MVGESVRREDDRRERDRERYRDRDRHHERERYRDERGDRPRTDRGERFPVGRDRDHATEKDGRRDQSSDRNRRVEFSVDTKPPVVEPKKSEEESEDAIADYQARVEAKLEELDEEAHAERLREERRRKREELLATLQAPKRVKEGSESQQADAMQSKETKLPEDAVMSESKQVSALDTTTKDIVEIGKRVLAAPVYDMFNDESVAAPVASASGRTGAEDWDDADGYYRYRNGDVLSNRFVVFGSHGQGVFSTVLRARDKLNGDQEFAVKVVRANDVMRKAGQREAEFLHKLQAADPEGQRGIVRLCGEFEFRGHLCLIFEPLHLNLRQLLGIYGRNIGLSIHAVRAYSRQMFIALRLLRRCHIVHADIKPDNILINEEKTQIRLCDLGSALYVSDVQPTPYLVSRFYRAPEIMLGCKFDYGIDMWSIGCTLAELYTGRILFQGRNNHDMLRLFMTIKGRLPKKLLKTGRPEIVGKYFDDGLNLRRLDDPTRRMDLPEVSGTSSVFLPLLGNLEELTRADRLKVEQFADLLDKMFAFDPAKRITPELALEHPFCRKHLPAPTTE